VKEEYKSFFKINKDWPKYGAVEFKNVVLKYRPNLEVALKNLTFETKPGEKIGVVGRTGAGKSTICLSLSRIVEIIEGCILIDNIDIRELPLNEIRSRITVIPQDPTMFTGTLKYNLDPENKYDDEKCVSLLRRAKLEELLNKDSKGIH
jgi:ABC-type multidrug transport system fused ATPase/permease subunit